MLEQEQQLNSKKLDLPSFGAAASPPKGLSRVSISYFPTKKLDMSKIPNPEGKRQFLTLDENMKSLILCFTNLPKIPLLGIRS